MKSDSLFFVCILGVSLLLTGCSKVDFANYYVSNAHEYAGGNIDAPIKIDEASAPKDFIQIFYNDSDNLKTFPLAEGEYLDPWEKQVSDSLSVTLRRSKVLLRK